MNRLDWETVFNWISGIFTVLAVANQLSGNWEKATFFLLFAVLNQLWSMGNK